MRIDANLSALSAIGVDMAVSANNVANMNTPEFKASRVDLETGPDGQGVRVAGINETTAPGPLLPWGGFAPDGSVQTRPMDWPVEGSNTDLVAEFTRMMVDQNAYAANASAIRSQADADEAVTELFL